MGTLPTKTPSRDPESGGAHTPPPRIRVSDSFQPFAHKLHCLTVCRIHSRFAHSVGSVGYPQKDVRK